MEASVAQGVSERTACCHELVAQCACCGVRPLLVLCLHLGEPSRPQVHVARNYKYNYRYHRYCRSQPEIKKVEGVIVHRDREDLCTGGRRRAKHYEHQGEIGEMVQGCEEHC